MDRKRDETSPTPEDKQKLESEVNARNLYEQIVSQGDINRYYATSNSNEIVIQDNSGYEWQTLDVTATIKQENEPRTSAVVRISVNDKGAGGSGDNLVKTSVPNSFSVSSKNKRNNSRPSISLSRSPSFSFPSPKKFNEENNIKYWGLIINFGKSKPAILKDELVQNNGASTTTPGLVGRLGEKHLCMNLLGAESGLDQIELEMRIPLQKFYSMVHNSRGNKTPIQKK